MILYVSDATHGCWLIIASCDWQLENRQQEELAELQQRLDKEMQTLHTSLARELDADAQHQTKERERAQKSAVASEAKRRKHIQQLHELELKQLHQQQKREYQKNKDDFRKVTAVILSLLWMLCHWECHIQMFFKNWNLFT